MFGDDDGYPAPRKASKRTLRKTSRAIKRMAESFVRLRDEVALEAFK